jgi:hypothetical protein
VRNRVAVEVFDATEGEFDGVEERVIIVLEGLFDAVLVLVTLVLGDRVLVTRAVCVRPIVLDPVVELVIDLVPFADDVMDELALDVFDTEEEGLIVLDLAGLRDPIEPELDGVSVSDELRVTNIVLESRIEEV